MNISRLSQSTSSAIRKRSGLKTVEWRKPAHDNSRTKHDVSDHRASVMFQCWPPRARMDSRSGKGRSCTGNCESAEDTHHAMKPTSFQQPITSVQVALRRTRSRRSLRNKMSSTRIKRVLAEADESASHGFVFGVNEGTCWNADWSIKMLSAASTQGQGTYFTRPTASDFRRTTARVDEGRQVQTSTMALSNSELNEGQPYATRRQSRVVHRN